MYHGMEGTHGVTSQRLASTAHHRRQPAVPYVYLVRSPRFIIWPRPSARAAFSLAGPIDPPAVASAKMCRVNSFAVLRRRGNPSYTVLSRPTVDWDTSQADDFRERGGSWTRTRTLEGGRAARSDRRGPAQRRPGAAGGCRVSGRPGGAATATGREPGASFAVARRDSRDTHRLA